MTVGRRGGIIFGLNHAGATGAMHGRENKQEQTYVLRTSSREKAVLAMRAFRDAGIPFAYRVEARGPEAGGGDLWHLVTIPLLARLRAQPLIDRLPAIPEDFPLYVTPRHGRHRPVMSRRRRARLIFAIVMLALGLLSLALTFWQSITLLFKM